jgi:hypothetical protein
MGMPTMNTRSVVKRKFVFYFAILIPFDQFGKVEETFRVLGELKQKTILRTHTSDVS